MTNLLTILTTRTDSTRLPGKALLPVKSRLPDGKKETQPLVVWIARRLRQLPGVLVAATTTEASDNELAAVLRKEGIEVIRGSVDDVISRMEAVIETGQYPADFVLRGLGDMPFLATELVTRGVEAMARYNTDALVYHLSPDTWPVYGSREMPYSLNAWRKIARHSTIREHPDQYFHDNRRVFNILYHQPPPNIYFRPFRLEVDHAADLEMVREIAGSVGMLAPAQDVIKFLDANPAVARINADYVEKTGPLSLNSYSNGKRREWLNCMIGSRVLGWNGEWIEPPGKGATPIFCTCGHSLGFGWKGRLYLPDGSVMDSGFPKCKNCGLMVREWRAALERRAA